MNTPASVLPLHGALRLSDWGLIRAQGADARSFLQSQLTQDVQSLAVGHARLAGYCSAKGRLLASFLVWAEADGALMLACSADILAPTLKRLRMFVLRAKCQLDDVSAEPGFGPLWGLTGHAAGDAAPGSMAFGPDWRRVALPPADVQGVRVARALQLGGEQPAASALDAATWLGLEAASGVARIVAATVEQFVPQMVNLDLVGGVSFKKGCYPGQEVVARSQYRGTLKRRACLLHGAVAMAPGQEVVHSDDPAQPAGRIVLAGALPGVGPVALAEMKLAALDGGSLHLNAADGPLLTPAALPYELPAEAA